MNYALIFWAEQYITSGLSAILYSTMPLWGQVFAHLRLPNERLTAPRLIGVLIGIAGVFVIFSSEIEVEGALGMLGTAAVLVAAMMTAYANVEIKKYGKDIPSLVMSAVQISFGFIPLVALGLFREGNPYDLHWTMTAKLSLVYLALVGSSVAFGLYYWLIHRIPVTRIQLIPLFSTLLAVLLGAVVLHEAVTWRTAVGGVAILGGLGLAVKARSAGT
jgi:drug/metabolite transporter (DMT)-like permease